QLATVRDPLGHTWTREYDGNGFPTGVVDPLGHRTGVTMNASGQVTQVLDSLQHVSQFGYLGGDLVSITDPLNRTATQFLDAAGRRQTQAGVRFPEWHHRPRLRRARPPDAGSDAARHGDVYVR